MWVQCTATWLQSRLMPPQKFGAPRYRKAIAVGWEHELTIMATGGNCQSFIATARLGVAESSLSARAFVTLATPRGWHTLADLHKRLRNRRRRAGDGSSIDLSLHREQFAQIPRRSTMCCSMLVRSRDACGQQAQAKIKSLEQCST